MPAPISIGRPEKHTRPPTIDRRTALFAGKDRVLHRSTGLAQSPKSFKILRLTFGDNRLSAFLIQFAHGHLKEMRMSQLSRLRDDHAKLARMFGRLGEIIARKESPPQLELFELRRELMGTLIA